MNFVGERRSRRITRRQSLQILGAAGLSLAFPPCLAYSDKGARKWPNIPVGVKLDMSQPDPLKEFWSIGELKIKNRIVKSATGERMADKEFRPTPTYAAFNRRLAQGGAGLIVTGNMYTQLVGAGTLNFVVLDGDDKIRGLEKATEAVHREGGRIIGQINDSGGSADYTGAVGIRVRAPSGSPGRWGSRKKEEITEKEIEQAIWAYGASAVRVQKAGFDGVEIHGGHDYLISEFLNPRTNRRADSWGGSLENRQRFALEVCKEVRRLVGKSFPIIIKMNGDFGRFGQQNMADEVSLAKRLDKEGIDGFDITCGGGVEIVTGSLGGFGTFREHRNLSAARAIKKEVSKPVFVVGGNRDPEAMRIIVQQKYVDAVSMARPILRDPDFPSKILDGLAPRSGCLNTNQCFLGIGARPVRCYNVWPNPFDSVSS